MTRIGIIADVHCGPDRDALPGSRTPGLLDIFVDAMRTFRPRCVVDLGDRINSVASGQDRARARYVRRRLQETGVPVFHVLGNTDVEHLSKDEAATAVGKASAAEVVDLEGLRLMLLDTVDPVVERVGGAVGRRQLDWLEAALRQRPVPCLVFGHHPLDEPALAGHRYFEERPDLARLRNGDEVLRVLASSGRVLAAFAGHLHWTCATRGTSLPHVTLGSLVDSAYTAGEPCGAYALATVEDDRIEVVVEGRRPARFTLQR
jgi:3',5'-cyclic AMP phosphodiesterase CpdA